VFITFSTRRSRSGSAATVESSIGRSSRPRVTRLHEIARSPRSDRSPARLLSGAGRRRRAGGIAGRRLLGPHLYEEGLLLRPRSALHRERDIELAAVLQHRPQVGRGQVLEPAQSRRQERGGEPQHLGPRLQRDLPGRRGGRAEQPRAHPGDRDRDLVAPGLLRRERGEGRAQRLERAGRGPGRRPHAHDPGAAVAAVPAGDRHGLLREAGLGELAGDPAAQAVAHQALEQHLVRDGVRAVGREARQEDGHLRVVRGRQPGHGLRERPRGAGRGPGPLGGPRPERLLHGAQGMPRIDGSGDAGARAGGTVAERMEVDDVGQRQLAELVDPRDGPTLAAQPAIDEHAPGIGPEPLLPPPLELADLAAHGLRGVAGVRDQVGEQLERFGEARGRTPGAEHRELRLDLHLDRGLELLEPDLDRLLRDRRRAAAAHDRRGELGETVFPVRLEDRARVHHELDPHERECGVLERDQAQSVRERRPRGRRRVRDAASQSRDLAGAGLAGLRTVRRSAAARAGAAAGREQEREQAGPAGASGHSCPAFSSGSENTTVRRAGLNNAAAVSRSAEPLIAP
jgi:hypothetical protein